jgi:hypothetical protein
MADLITLLENRIVHLQRARDSFVSAGDVAGVNDVDNQIIETQATLAGLRTLV